MVVGEVVIEAGKMLLEVEGACPPSCHLEVTCGTGTVFKIYLVVLGHMFDTAVN